MTIRSTAEIMVAKGYAHTVLEDGKGRFRVLGDTKGLIARLCVGAFVFFMTNGSDTGRVFDPRQICIEVGLQQAGPDSSLDMVFTTIMLANR